MSNVGQSPNRTFQHITPALRLFSGRDCLQQLGRELDRIGSRRAVVVCGNWAEGPLLEAIRLTTGERLAGIVSNVQAHSPLSSVQEAADAMKRLDADAVIALGGGSSIVTARAASILLAEEGDPRSLCTRRDASGKLHSPKLNQPKLPQFIVPTTPTTAMVKAGSAVFDPDSGERLALFDPKTRAHAIFISPEFFLSSPVGLSVSASLNTFSMAIEGLVSRAGDPISDALMTHALRLLIEYLPRAVQPEDIEAREALMHAAVLCGQGSDYTAAGVTTVLGHAIGARHHVDNGIVNAIVLPHVLRFNGTVAAPGLSHIATALGLHAGQDTPEVLDRIVRSVEDLFRVLGVPRKLRDVGLEQDKLQDVANHAMGDWFLTGNPRTVRSAQELVEVLQSSW